MTYAQNPLFLGIIFDEFLTFEVHIARLAIMARNYLRTRID